MGKCIHIITLWVYQIIFSLWFHFSPFLRCLTCTLAVWRNWRWRPLDHPSRSSARISCMSLLWYPGNVTAMTSIPHCSSSRTRVSWFSPIPARKSSIFSSVYSQCNLDQRLSGPLDVMITHGWHYIRTSSRLNLLISLLSEKMTRTLYPSNIRVHSINSH